MDVDCWFLKVIFEKVFFVVVVGGEEKVIGILGYKEVLVRFLVLMISFLFERKDLELCLFIIVCGNF